VQIDDPAEALRWQEDFARSKLMHRRKEFVERRLTRAERKVTTLVCQGLDNSCIVAKLHKTNRTVANQLTSVYGKLDERLGFPGVTVDRSVVFAELAPYFELIERRAGLL
jgi:CRISPR-associated protein Csx14